MRVRRGRDGTGAKGDDLLARFGVTCPVCGATLGAAPVWDDRRGRFATPPCFRLEIGPPDHLQKPSWRVTTVGGNFPPAISTAPVFIEREIDYVYLLCGDGHIFPDANPINHRDGRRSDGQQRVDRWNMVAAVGALASGKTYLLLRTLNQDLDNPENWDPSDDDSRVRLHKLNPLEEIPLKARSDQYAKTLAAHLPIAPTLMERAGTPFGILEQELPDVLAAIQDIIRRTVVDGERRAERWGRGFRQPLVIRTDSASRLTWTGVADLPGELFDRNPVNPRERVKLRAYDALLWVIDPAVAATALDPVARDSIGRESDYNGVLAGSLRPGTTGAEGAGPIRALRDQIQLEIGRSLTLVDNEYAADQGRALQMLIAVTKCDLIHAALRKKRLPDLGPSGVVSRGTAGYLAFAATRWAEERLDVDANTAALLSYLHAASSADRAVRKRRILQVATGLLDHYSRRDEFWNLVHGGLAERVEIPDGDHMSVRRWLIEVPSIGVHLDQATAPGSARRLLLRDLIMSAVGCGIAYGLGHESAIFKILREAWQDLRIFLCSPLGTLPVARQRSRSDAAGPEHLLEPLEPGERFPTAQERSAALTQLLLSMLGKARA